jgi:nicotinamidase-related amidase
MQRDFALPEGSAFVEGTDLIIPAFTDLIHNFRKMERPIFHAVRLYLEDGSNAERCRRLRVRGGTSIARPGTNGARPLDAVQPDTEPDKSSTLLTGEYVPLGVCEWLFYKSRWSAFYRTGLEERLRALRVDTVVVAGCNFPNCPSATLFDASERDFRAVLVSDAVSGLADSGGRWCTGIGVVQLTAEQVAGKIDPNR